MFFALFGVLYYVYMNIIIYCPPQAVFFFFVSCACKSKNSCLFSLPRLFLFLPVCTKQTIPAHSRHINHSASGPHSFDQKRGVSPSTSMGSISETKPQHHHAKADDADISPERALRSLRGPEHWTKGERHAILPGVLSMCPIQVLNSVMSKKDDGVVVSSAFSNNNNSGGSSRSSLTRGGSLRGSGIGSIISEPSDDGLDSNGWFFADHHQQQPTSSSISSSVVVSRGGTTLPRPNSGGGGGGVKFGKIVLGKATAAPLGMRSFLNEVYGWCTGIFILRQNYLFEYREGDSLNGLPWAYAHLPLGEVYPHKHFTNALHLDFFERPCTKSGKRSVSFTYMYAESLMLLRFDFSFFISLDVYHLIKS